MSKPRILFVLHLPPPVHGASLVGSFIRESALVEEAFETRWVNLAVSTRLSEVRRFTFRKVFTILRLLREVRATVRSWRPDLVYMTPSSTMPALLKDVLLVLGMKGCRKVFHFHNKGVSRRQDRFLDDRLYRILFRDASVILLSGLLYPDIRKYVPEELVSYCPNGVSVPTVIRRPCTPPRILFLSNMIRSKGVSVLVDACRLLQARGIPFRCSLVGALSADYPGDSLAVEIREKGLEGCVTYEGPRYGDEKWKAFSEADVFAFPTSDDCFPLVVLEAMGAGLPVVTTDEGALPEMVRDGLDGIICEKRNPQSLADALARLLTDRAARDRMGMSGKARCQELYTRERFERRLVEILQSLADA